MEPYENDNHVTALSHGRALQYLRDEQFHPARTRQKQKRVGEGDSSKVSGSVGARIIMGNGYQPDAVEDEALMNALRQVRETLAQEIISILAKKCPYRVFDDLSAPELSRDLQLLLCAAVVDLDTLDQHLFEQRQTAAASDGRRNAHK